MEFRFNKLKKRNKIMKLIMLKRKNMRNHNFMLIIMMIMKICGNIKY